MSARRLREIVLTTVVIIMVWRPHSGRAQPGSQHPDAAERVPTQDADRDAADALSGLVERFPPSELDPVPTLPPEAYEWRGAHARSTWTTIGVGPSGLYGQEWDFSTAPGVALRIGAGVDIDVGRVASIYLEADFVLNPGTRTNDSSSPGGEGSFRPDSVSTSFGLGVTTALRLHIAGGPVFVGPSLRGGVHWFHGHRAGDRTWQPLGVLQPGAIAGVETGRVVVWVRLDLGVMANGKLASFFTGTLNLSVRLVGGAP